MDNKNTSFPSAADHDLAEIPNELHPIMEWFKENTWEPADFQIAAWHSILSGKSGIVNAPTGCGKTYAVLLGALASISNQEPKGLKIIWITPIRALAREIQISCERAVKHLKLGWTTAIRTGDTQSGQKAKQLKQPPQILITTPESLHVLLATKGYPAFFNGVQYIVADEWHELFGSKRGVQTELFLSRILPISPQLSVWGISATIGNLQEAANALLFAIPESNRIIIKSSLKKKTDVISLMPAEIEKFPWAGHIGLRLSSSVYDIVCQHQSCLIFTNTRAQCEIWYHHLLDQYPDLAGEIAMHHGSISRELRDWVEDALYEGRLRAVVCTSSLDLGVDFRPVDSIVQIGSPKGVARFLQRAGRSGHQPGATSRIYFLPTHALELIEISGLRKAIENTRLEERTPYIRSFDVLMQYLMTLAVSEGFYGKQILEEVQKTFAFSSLLESEYYQILESLVYGSEALTAYEDFKKVVKSGDFYRVEDKRIILRHKLSIGTIVSDSMIRIQLIRGNHLGMVEEWFISQLKPGDHFWFSGRALELVRIKDMTAQVRLSKEPKGKIPAYMGGRMPLSSPLAAVLREKVYEVSQHNETPDVEMLALKPLFEMQQKLSSIPREDELLIEYFQSNEGYHLVFYPFEGRNVHEGMASFIAKRISLMQPVSFTMSMNDYGFELLSDTSLDIQRIINHELFSTKNLIRDIYSSVNSVELARRRFREIARIGGLIFTGFPGRQKKERHIQSSAQLLFEVFREYEPDNLLFMQTFEEVMTFQMEESRMRESLNRIAQQKLNIQYPEKPTPFAFPLIVDRLREKISSEKLEDRIRKMTLAYSK